MFKLERRANSAKGHFVILNLLVMAWLSSAKVTDWSAVSGYAGVQIFSLQYHWVSFIRIFLSISGRPVRAKETGLTEEELTDEVVTPSGQKVFRCKKCDKEFSFSSRLKRHLLVHTGARPFECHVCSRRFTQAVDLKRHMLRHSGQKPHVCQFCGKQYTRGDRLKVHLLQHTHEDNTEKPYNCSRCGASFFEAEQLRLHVCELQDGSRQVVVQPGE